MATTCELIASTTLGSAASFIEFTSVPGTHTDLLCVVTGRADISAANLDFYTEFNGVTTGYTVRRLFGNGSSAGSDNYTTMFTGIMPGATATASTFGNTEIYIPNYAGSTNKSVSSTGVAENNSVTGIIRACAGLWSNTAAITSLKLIPNAGYSFVSGSSAYLYGITRA